MDIRSDKVLIRIPIVSLAVFTTDANIDSGILLCSLDKRKYHKTSSHKVLVASLNKSNKLDRSLFLDQCLSQFRAIQFCQFLCDNSVNG